MDDRPVEVNEEVYKGLAYARRNGYRDFHAWGPPANFLVSAGFTAAGFWIIDHPDDYQRGFNNGFACRGKRGLVGFRSRLS